MTGPSLSPVSEVSSLLELETSYPVNGPNTAVKEHSEELSRERKAYLKNINSKKINYKSKPLMAYKKEKYCSSNPPKTVVDERLVNTTPRQYFATKRSQSNMEIIQRMQRDEFSGKLMDNNKVRDSIDKSSVSYDKERPLSKERKQVRASMKLLYVTWQEIRNALRVFHDEEDKHKEQIMKNSLFTIYTHHEDIKEAYRYLNDR